MLYTGKGDGGTTKLFHTKSGERLGKDAPLFDALGTVDELNSNLGYCKAVCSRPEYKNLLKAGGESYQQILDKLQQYLFSLQAELGGDQHHIKPAHVEYSEKLIAEIEKELPPITSFVVPGGSEISALLDVARTVTRRAERLIVGLEVRKEKDINPFSKSFINRLSSVLYALSRHSNHLLEFSFEKPTYE